MKKGTIFLLCGVLALSLTACGGSSSGDASAESNTDVELITEDASTSAEEVADDEEEVLEVDAPEVDTQGAYLVLDAFDAYDWPYSFVTDGAGTYTFATANAEGYEDITWSIYLFDEDVEDIAEGEVPALTGDGSIELAAGQYVYCVCSYSNATQEQAVSGASTLVIWYEADQEAQADTSTVTIDAAEAYDSSAFSFRAAQSGTYQAVSVTAEGFSPADVGCDAEEVAWSFYVLDEPFDDAVRYLPQACDSVLEGDGSFEVEQGQYVYCLCNVSAFTADEMPEGQNTLTLTLE
ncbi:MAG: hypothetical protein LUG44_06715 [Clostridiales bacterium]|nr:hypothetical protein [Clostridiales bacterium]